MARTSELPVPSAEEQFEALRQAVHLTSRDDYFATMLAQPAPLGLGDRVRFDHSTHMWHIWDGIRWRPDRTNLIFEKVRDRLVNVWLPSKSINPSEDSMKVYATMLNLQKKKSVLETLTSFPAIAMTGEEWDLHPTLMGFENGILDLKTLSLDTDPDPALLISRSTGFDWDPEADYNPFTNFIEEIMSHDPDTAAYLLRMLGYSMIGTNQEQKFWMWVGGGSNGKGILARTVTKALGDYAYSPPDTLYMRNKFGAVGSDKARPELLKLQGARFTFMSEPQGGQFNDELLKAHSGNDPIEARTLYSSKYKTFTPTHKIVFLTNEPPRTDDVGPSMQRRVRIIRFMEDYRDPKRADNELEGRLQSPDNLRGALVAMAVQAHQYLQTSQIPEPVKVTAWSRAYIAENDPVTSFIDTMCVQGTHEEVPGGQFYKAFDAFCETNGYEKLSMNNFARTMMARFERKSRAAGNFYIGIRLKNITDHAEEVEDDD